MPRRTFEQEKARLKKEVLSLGSMVEEALVDAVDALVRGDRERARQIVRDDVFVNEKRMTLELDTLALIATQQPMASDLRALAAVLEIITELERIGDYAKGIAKICLNLEGQPLVFPSDLLMEMTQKATDMLRRSLEIFMRQDVEAARDLPREDDEVDVLYDQVYRMVVMGSHTDPEHMDQASLILWAAHNLERTADRVTNICERIVFTGTGEMTELDWNPDHLAALAR
ncbi:MAG: phosphate signaling complex protein PhoU [Anaerolineae bacterium]